MSAAALVEVECDVLRTSERGVLICDHDTRSEAWLPLSQVEVERSDCGRHHVVTMPEWLALERGLV